MMRIAVYSVLLAFVFVSCSLNRSDEPESAVIPPQKGLHSTCESCHSTKAPQPGAASFALGLEPSSLCIHCHNYTENHHPVDFVPASSMNASMPLFDGKVKCLTCHEIHGGPAHAGTKNLLRGGPYLDRRESCFQCHDQSAYEAINPHEMLDKLGNIRQVNGQPVCLVCHSKKPDPAVDRTNDVRFRADVGFLCWRCHPPMPGDFFDDHFLVTPVAETLQFMVESEARLQVILPLVPRGRITCSTCHNPHQEGVMQHAGAAKGADATFKLRLLPNCQACHST